MMLVDFFDADETDRLFEVRSDRVLYGMGFPNFPYAWDRDLRWLDDPEMSAEWLSAICGETALDVYAF